MARTKLLDVAAAPTFMRTKVPALRQYVQPETIARGSTEVCAIRSTWVPLYHSRCSRLRSAARHPATANTLRL